MSMGIKKVPLHLSRGGGVQRYEYSFRGKMVGWLAVAVAFAVASAFAAAASAAAATAATASAAQHVHRLAVLLG